MRYAISFTQENLRRLEFAIRRETNPYARILLEQELAALRRRLAPRPRKAVRA